MPFFVLLRVDGRQDLVVPRLAFETLGSFRGDQAVSFLPAVNAEATGGDVEYGVAEVDFALPDDRRAERDGVASLIEVRHIKRVAKFLHRSDDIGILSDSFELLHDFSFPNAMKDIHSIEAVTLSHRSAGGLKKQRLGQKKSASVMDALSASDLDDEPGFDHPEEDRLAVAAHLTAMEREIAVTVEGDPIILRVEAVADIAEPPRRPVDAAFLPLLEAEGFHLLVGDTVSQANPRPAGDVAFLRRKTAAFETDLPELDHVEQHDRPDRADAFLAGELPRVVDDAGEPVLP